MKLRESLVVWVLGLVGFSLPGLATEQIPLSEADVAGLRSVVQTAVSPDGRWIAYTLSVPRDLRNDENGSAFVELHVVDRDGNSRPFVSGDVNVSAIRWRPDSTGISYLAERGDDEHAAIYLIPIDGGESRQLVQFDTSISGYVWNQDGTQIAFLAKDMEDEEFEQRREDGFNAEIYEEQLRSTRIHVVDIDGDTAGEPVRLETEGSASEISFGPDDRRIAAALAPTPLIDDYYMYRRVRILEVDTGKVVAEVANPGKLGRVAWSPNGQFLALCSGADIHDPSPGRLMVVSSEGGTPREIMPEYLPNIIDFVWLDDDRIAFLAEDSCERAVGEVKRDGSGLKLYSESGETPILQAMSASADKATFSFHGSTPQHPNEVYRYENGSLTKLTDHNPELPDRKMGRQEVVSWQSRDGKRIDGVLLYPTDYQEGQRYPLIIMVHGGPEASVANGWNTRYADPGQVAAGRGFVVFYPNYRGSTGRGVEFAKDHQSDYGGKEFNDVIDGLDALVERGLVDPKRVGMTGGSYGGFATAWCCTFHSEKFAAGVMFVGISNQISKSGTTDIPEEMFLVHARKRIWDDWQFFLERSPVYHVQKCETPLLILHGKNDTRVHPSQSLELYRNLKILRKPVRLVFYPGEGHGNRKSAARYDYNLRMMRWMQHYLQNDGSSLPPHELDYELTDDTQNDDRGDQD